MDAHKKLQHKFRAQRKIVWKLTTLVHRLCLDDYQREEKICHAMLDPERFNTFLAKVGRSDGEACAFLASLAPPKAKLDQTVYEGLPWWRLLIAKWFSL